MAGRVSHPLDDEQSFMKASTPPIPFDQPCLVALNFLSARPATRTHCASIMRDETRPGQARGLGRRHVAVRRDDRHAFLPQLLEILGALWRSGLPDTCSGRPSADGQYSRRPGFVWFVLNPGLMPTFGDVPLWNI